MFITVTGVIQAFDHKSVYNIACDIWHETLDYEINMLKTWGGW